MNQLKLGIVSCGFLGLSPVAPGTAGTLGGVAIAWALGYSGGRYPLLVLLVSLVLYVLGRSLGAWAEAHAGGKDPGFFVLDEVIGYLLTCWWLRAPSLLTLTLGFFVFRFYDIVKPPPARRLEALGGGDGILLDDVFAGLYGLGTMALARVLLPGLPWSLG
jgi:phosphatidylglycerophosphatase A